MTMGLVMRADPDLSGAIARMLIEGEGIPPGASPSEMTDLILDRWPHATAGEIERGFRVAIEIQTADDATARIGKTR